MENVAAETKPPLYIKRRLVNSSLCSFDLPSLIDDMKHSRSWERGELNSVILLKSPQKQIVLAAIQGGTEIKSFQSNDSITLEIIEGKLKFRCHKESIILSAGQFFTVNEKIKYRLATEEETVFLITIANNNLRQAEY
jgi:quercetin dioxygenase-like cupin family protein